MAGNVAAIDFGTTYTTAAVRDESGVSMIGLDHHDSRLPSLVLRSRDAAGTGSWVVGWAAANQAALFPDAVERTPKRRLGVDDDMLLGGEMLPVVDAVAAVLAHAWAMIIAQRPDVDSLVVTHPAAWPSRRTELLVDAARRAGISAPVRLCPEPVAAALAYSAENAARDGLFAVYDLGGGTIDVAVLAGGATGFELVAPPSGDPNLGGEDFDERIFQHLAHQLDADAAGMSNSLTQSTERSWRVAAEQLRIESRRAKEALSSSASYALYLPPPVARDLTLQGHELRDLISDDISRSVNILASVIATAEQATGQPVTGVYLVGGGSRIPAVQHTIESRTGLPCMTRENPKDVVARGATLWQPETAAAPREVTRTADLLTGPVTTATSSERSWSPPVVEPAVTPTSSGVDGGPIAWAAELAGRIVAVRPGDGHTAVSLQEGDHLLRQVGLPGSFVGAAVGRSAALIVTFDGRQTTCSVLDPQLALRTVASLGTGVARWVRAAGSHAWVITAGRRDMTGPSMGLPWGDSGRMNVWRIDLEAVINVTTPAPPLQVALWRINEGHARTLLDPSSATTCAPDAALMGGVGRLAWAVGQFDSRRQPGLSRNRAHLDVRLRQLLITDDGSPQPFAEPIDRAPWVHQVVYDGTTRYTSGSDGIRDSSGAVLLERPALGATRLLDSPVGPLTLSVDRVLEESDCTIGRIVRGRHDVLWTGRVSPLRHPYSADQPIVAAGYGADAIVPVRTGISTVLLQIAEDGTVKELAPYAGWCEPVSTSMQSADGLTCLTASWVPTRASDPPPVRFNLEFVDR